ncbi:sensor histidine kinase [Aquipuribacter sp. SD81]|uniref:sensor histidine kinase n=1 Tax=Aquipuribacter sp. SD81 TaxID=3127703 RepID=UPI00301B2C2C
MSSSPAAVASAPAVVGAGEHPAVAVSRVPRWTTRLDLAVAGALALWAVCEALVIPELRSPGGLAFAVGSTAPLVVRRRFPVLVMVTVCAVLLVQSATGGAGASFAPFPGLLVASFTVAVHVAPLVPSLVVGALPVAAMLLASRIGFFGEPGIEVRGGLILVFFVGAAWAGGRVVRQRALAVRLAEERRVRAEADARESRAGAALAVEAERARIARELHDVVAHAVSVVVLQTGAAEQFLDRDVERARRHLGLARRTAAEAMTEMRHLLDVLREGEAVYVPQPGLDRVPDLVADARAAGLPVSLTTTVEGSLPDGLSLAVHRIVQESLTNVLRHAPGAPTTVRVATAGDGVDVEVVNGPPPRPGGSGLSRGGHGLPGMAERVRVYGGTLAAGPDGEGGWRVHAHVPVGHA